MEDLIKEIEEIVKANNLELFGVKIVNLKDKDLVRIFIDKEYGGITLDECVQISRLIGLKLDVLDVFPRAYTLEVSSPGVDWPIDVEDQKSLKRVLNQVLEINYLEEEKVKKMRAKLLQVSDNEIVVRKIDKKHGKSIFSEEIVLEKGKIKKIKQILLFEKIEE